MEYLYKLNEYSGKLPNPKHFPVRGGIITAIKDKPNAFCDGFMLDLSVRGADKKVLDVKVIRTVGNISSLLGEALISKQLLSEPEFIYDFTLLSYVTFTPMGNPVLLQVKYYRYFRNRNKGCKFYKRDEDSFTITVKVEEEIVGLCMPVVVDGKILNKIMEERDVRIGKV